MSELKPCTCHPSERPALCQHKYALTDCWLAARTPAPASADAMEVVHQINSLPYATVTNRTSPPQAFDRDQAAAAVIQQYGDQCRTDERASPIKVTEGVRVWDAQQLAEIYEQASLRHGYYESLIAVAAAGYRRGVEAAAGKAVEYVDDWWEENMREHILDALLETQEDG